MSMSSNREGPSNNESSSKGPAPAQPGVRTGASRRENSSLDESLQDNLGALAEIFQERAAPAPPSRPKPRSGKGLRSAISDSLGDGRLWHRRSGETMTALVPQASISGRALIIVIVIMTFLASITAGAVGLIATASASWSNDVAREMTIQVRPKSGRSIDADVAKAVEISSQFMASSGIRAYTRQESERLLEPWLGTALPFDQMPVPRIIVLSLDAGKVPDLVRLKAKLSEELPTAALDDHRQWSGRLTTMARAMTLVGLSILVLVLAATALAIGFATQGAMSGTREIINVLHLVGAEDRFIADEFQRHFLMMGLRGGVIGSGLAIVAFLLAGFLSNRWTATPQGEQIEALFGTFGLGLGGYTAVGGIAVVVAGLTAIVTRFTVYKNLRDVN